MEASFSQLWLHIAVYFLYTLLCIYINNSTLIVPDNTSTSEHHSVSQDVVPKSDHVTVHSTPAGKHSLIN